MKRIVAFALTLAMLVTLLPIGVFAQDTQTVADNGVALKPFYTTSWTIPDEALDYVYDMPYTWSNGTPILTDPDDENSPKTMSISFGKYGTSNIATIAQKMKEDFDARPAGTRVINFSAMTDAFKDNEVNSIDFTVGVEMVKNWLGDFLAEYSSIGGKLDGVAVDLEYNWAYTNYLHTEYTSGRSSSSGANTAVYANIVGSDVYKNKIRPILVERGFTFYPYNESAAEVWKQTELGSIYKYSGNAYANSRSIWDKLVGELLNEYINEAVYTPVHAFYPDAIVSDYHTVDYQAWLKGAAASGGASGGKSDKVGNASAYSANYAGSPDLDGYFYYESLGNKTVRTKYTSPVGFNDAMWEATPFNMAMWDVNRFKTMLEATDNGNIVAWHAGFNYGVKEGSTGRTPYYAEIMYHLGLLDATFYGYTVKSEMGAEFQLGMEILNDIMSELTRVAGTADRKPLKNLSNWNGSYMLTGMNAGGRDIYRLTPDTTKVSVENFKVVGDVPTFQVDGLTITFPQGRIIKDTAVREIGTCGYWIEVPAGVAPVITSSTDRYANNPAFVEDFAKFDDVLAKETYWTVSGTAVMQDGALALSGNTTVTNQKVTENVTAGDAYATKQAWEVNVTLPQGTYGDVTLLSTGAGDGIKISGGKAYYYDANGTAQVIGDIAAGTYTVKRVVDLSAMTSSYYVGTLKAENKAMKAVTTPVASIIMSTVGATDAVLVDDYKLYQLGMNTTLDIYETASAKKVDAASAVSGSHAYRVSWMNASEKAQKVTIKNGSAIIESFTVAPGMDGWTYGFATCAPSALTVTVEETTYTAPEINTDTNWPGMNENLGIACVVADKGYATLAEAIAAAEAGQTIMLLKDIQLATPTVVTKDIVIRGNGFAISAADNFSGDSVMNIAANGKLTVIDGLAINGGAKAGIIVEGGTLNVEGGKISGKDGIIVKGGNLNMTAGTVTATTGAAIVVVQDAAKTPINVKATGGKLVGDTAFRHYNANATASENVTVVFSDVEYTGVVKTEEEHCAIFYAQKGFHLHQHTVEYTPAVEGDCETPGTTQGIKYTCCGTVVKEPTAIGCKHNLVAPEGATCGDRKVCATCGKLGGEIVDHTFEVVDGAHVCTTCGLSFTGTTAKMYYISMGTNAHVGSYSRTLTEGKTYWFAAKKSDPDYPNNIYPVAVTNGSLTDESDSYIKFTWPTGGTPTLVLKNVELKSAIGLILGGHYDTRSAALTSSASGHDIPYNVQIIGENTITELYAGNYGAYSPLGFTTLNEANIYGDGTLNLVSDKGYNGTITNYGDINFIGANVTLTHPDAVGYSNGIQAIGGDITVTGGKLSVVALDNTAANNETIKWVFTADNITIEDGAKVNVDAHAYNGIFNATGDIKIDNADVETKDRKGTPLANKTPVITGASVITSTAYPAFNEDSSALVAPTTNITEYTAEEFNALESLSGIHYFKTTHACVKGTAFTLEAPEYPCSTTQDKVYTCTICGGEVREAVAVANPAAHTPGETKETAKVEATADAKGSYTLTTFCADCGEAISTETVETTYNTAASIAFTYAIDYSNLGNKTISRGSTVYLKQDASNKPAAGSEGDWTIKLEYPVDRPATLTLKGANLSGQVGLIFGEYHAKDATDNGKTVTCNVPLNIVLEGENYIYASHTNLGALDLYTTGDITISGDGSLYLKNNRSSANGGALNAYGNLTLDNADVTVELDDTVNNSSIVIATHGKDLTVDGGKLYIDAYDDPSVTNNYEAAKGLFSGNNVTIKNGADVKAGVTLCADNNIGVNVTGDFTIDNSDVEIGFYTVKSATQKTFVKAPVLQFAGDYEFTASATRKQAFFNTAEFTFAPSTPIDYETYLTKDVGTVTYLKTVHACVKSDDFVMVNPEYPCSTEQGKLYHCVYCGADMPEFVPVEGETAAHTDSGEIVEIEAVTATAEANGYYKLAKVCAVCGEYYDVQTVETTLNPDTVQFTFAAAYKNLTSSGATISRGTTKYYKNNGSGFITTGSAAEWNVKFEYPEDRPAVLTLKDVDFNGIGFIFGQYSASYPSTVTCNVPIEIVLIGENTVDGVHGDNNYKHGALNMYTNGDVTIKGDGSLTAYGSTGNIKQGAINAHGNLTLDNVDITVICPDDYGYASAVSSGNGNLTVKGGSLDIISLNDSTADGWGGYVNNNETLKHIFYTAGDLKFQDGAKVTAKAFLYQQAFNVGGTITIDHSDVEIGNNKNGGSLFNANVAPTIIGDYTLLASTDYCTISSADATMTANKATITDLTDVDVTTLQYLKINHVCVKGDLIEEGSAEYACSTKKVDKYACVHCGGVIEEITPVEGATALHTAGEAQEVERVEATASTNGYYVMKTFCTVCGEEIAELTETVTLYARTTAYLHWIAYGTNGPVGSYKQTLTAGQGPIYFTIGTDADYPNNLYPQKVTDGTVPEDNYIMFDYTGEVATLTLKNVTIKNCLGLTLGEKYDAKSGTPTHTTNYKVVIEGENTIQTMNLTNWNPLDFTTIGNVTIAGADENSSLTLISDTGYNGVLGTYGNLDIVDANITIKLPETASKAHAISANGGDITIDNSTVYIVGGDDPNTDANGGSANGNAMLAAIYGDDLTVKDSDLKVYGSPYHYCLIETDSFTIIDSSVELAITDRTYDYGMFKTAPTFKYTNENYIADASTKLSGFVADGYVVTVPETTVEYDAANVANYKYFKAEIHEHTLDMESGVVTAPTCQEQGYTTYTCTDCGRGVKQDFTPVAHNWVDATCTEPKTCPTCGLTEGEPLGHSFEQTVVAPTCNTPGGTQHTCAVCGISFITDQVAAKGHTKQTVAGYPATCKDAGLTDGVVCTVCGETLVEQEVIPAGEHNYVAVVTDPTCTEAGYITYTCSGCGDTYTEAGEAALGHGEYTYTDNEDGKTHTIACGKCDYTTTEDHTFVDGADCVCGASAHTHALTLVEAKEPTYGIAGNTAYYTCECGKYFSDAAGENEIAEGSWVIAALADGTDSKLAITNTSAGLPATLMLGADLKLSFNVSVKNTNTYDRVFLQITKLGTTMDVEVYSTSSSARNYRYTLAAPEMTAEMTVVVCGEKDGKIYAGTPITFTYKEIVVARMDAFYKTYETNAQSRNGCIMLANLLKYGEEAQKRFNISTDNLATAGLSDAYLAMINSETPTLDTWTAPAKATYYLGSYSPMLQEQIKIAFTFVTPKYTSLEGYEVKIVQTKSKDGSVVTHTFGADVLKSSSTTRIRCDFAIAGAEGRDQLEITLYKNGVAVSTPVVTNLGALAQGKSSTVALQPLLYAMMNYCDAAKAFFG